MTHVHDTFYVLEDGAKANPNDVAIDDKGVLRHKGGVAVAMRKGGVPRTSGAGPATAKVEDDAEKPPKPKDREMKAAGAGKTYQTR